MLIQPQPMSMPFSQMLSQIESGVLKIPQFQRDFVWGKAKSARLLDSILKGYPIGTFILWNTSERLRVVRNLGGLDLPDTPPGQFAHQVLDGQQRLTSLLAAVRGLPITRDGKVEQFREISVDLLADPATDDAVVLSEVPAGRDPAGFISIRDLVEANISVLGTYPAALHSRLQSYRDRLAGYNFSTILVHNAPIEVATEIFTRLNVEGQRLSTFEIMVAKTFDRDRDFDLAERYQALVGRLGEVDYDTIPNAVVLQTVGALQNRSIKAKDILKLDRQGFIDTWPIATDAIERAVDYFRSFFRVPVSTLLPYPHLLVPFAYFFAKHPNPPLDIRKDYLQDFFWRVALTSWYSRSVEGRIESDLHRMDAILAGALPDYEVGVDASARVIQDHGWFRTGRAWIKGILCLLAYHQPKSFANNGIVHISNDWLKQANSKNYHHFFPKGWAKNAGKGDDWRINHIANITIVDDFLNKRAIGAKAPSMYMKTFQKANPGLAATMATHLIDVAGDGVWGDDWDTFFTRRCERISAELSSRIIPRALDAPVALPEAEEEEPET